MDILDRRQKDAWESDLLISKQETLSSLDKVSFGSSIGNEL